MIRIFKTMHLVSVALAAALAFTSPAVADSHVKTPGPIAQPDPVALAPGLAVTYHFHLFNTVGEIPQWARSNDSVTGTPLRRWITRSVRAMS